MDPEHVRDFLKYGTRAPTDEQKREIDAIWDNAPPLAQEATPSETCVATNYFPSAKNITMPDVETQLRMLLESPPPMFVPPRRRRW